ncbi:hypothetical protein [Oscillibacter ruminantium]|uniref:hypothetical protein n=1 Tax=Oscillibacter ruminantium TaxID=1263547 RepID=UPI003320F62F
MKQKVIRSVLAMALLVSVLSVNILSVSAAGMGQGELRYTGVSTLISNLDISSGGAASCKGTAAVRSGYTADLTVELQRDGTTIKTWTNSGSGTLNAGGTYYVTSGHDYIVVTTAKVSDSNGNPVESPSLESKVKSY